MGKFEILQELLKCDGEILSEQSLWEEWHLWIYSMQVYKKLQFVKKIQYVEAYKGKWDKISYAYNYLTILLLPKGKNVANIFSNKSVIVEFIYVSFLFHSFSQTRAEVELLD